MAVVLTLSHFWHVDELLLSTPHIIIWIYVDISSPKPQVQVSEHVCVMTTEVTTHNDANFHTRLIFDILSFHTC